MREGQLTRICASADSLVPGLRGEGEQDHGELLLGDLAVAVEVAALHDRLLEVDQIRGVVVL